MEAKAYHTVTIKAFLRLQRLFHQADEIVQNGHTFCAEKKQYPSCHSFFAHTLLPSKTTMLQYSTVVKYSIIYTYHDDDGIISQ